MIIARCPSIGSVKVISWRIVMTFRSRLYHQPHEIDCVFDWFYSNVHKKKKKERNSEKSSERITRMERRLERKLSRYLQPILVHPRVPKPPLNGTSRALYKPPSSRRKFAFQRGLKAYKTGEGRGRGGKGRQQSNSVTLVQVGRVHISSGRRFRIGDDPLPGEETGSGDRAR